MDEVQIIEWVDQHQQADGMMLIQIVDQHQQTIGKVCRLYKDTGADKGNLFHAIAFQLWKSASTDNEKTKTGSWAYRIALTTAIVHNIIYNERSPDTLQTLMTLTDHNAELINALKQLTDDDKAIMTLYLEDLSYPEIAATTGLAETIVGVKLNRIKKKVQQNVISPNEQPSIKLMWQNIATDPKNNSELTEIIAEQSSPHFNFQNGFIPSIIAKSLAKGNDIKKSLEDVLKKIKLVAILGIASRTIIFAGLLLFARFTIKNDTTLLWVMAAAILLFIVQITLLSKTWVKRIGQMKNTIQHFRSQREFNKKGGV